MHRREMSPAVLLMWSNTLSAYSVEDIALGLARHLQDPDAGQYFPMPAHVIARLEGGTGTRAMRAWSLVDKAVRMVGHYVSVCFEDPIIHRVIDDMGGWTKLALTETLEDLKFRGIEFAKRYQGVVQTGGVGSDYPPYLIGASEAHNAVEGQRTAAPVLIGDPAKCEIVMGRSSGSAGLRITSSSSAKNIADGVFKRLGAKA
jgi:hypothetical protein